MKLLSWLLRPARPSAVNLPPPPTELAPAPIPVASVGAPVVLSADQRFARCIPIILAKEAGYVDHPSDPGGATNRGITLAYARSKGRLFDNDGDGDVDKEDIKLITVGQATATYREWFWRDVAGDDLPAGLDLVMFDYAVNSGPGRPIRALQTVLGLEADGVFGPKTRAGLVRLPSPRTGAIITICAERLAFMKRARHRKTKELLWPTFGRGWQARVEEIQRAALAMAV